MACVVTRCASERVRRSAIAITGACPDCVLLHGHRRLTLWLCDARVNSRILVAYMFHLLCTTLAECALKALMVLSSVTECQ